MPLTKRKGKARMAAGSGCEIPPLDTGEGKAVRLVFFDEAGSSTDDQQEPVLTVAAIVVHGDLQTLPIEKDARSIIDTLVPEQFRPHFEFHAKDLFSGSEKFRGWPKDGPTGRYAALGAFMNLIPKHNLPVLSGSINKPGFWKSGGGKIWLDKSEREKKHVPHAVGFMFCIFEVETWFLENAPYERGLCIADETKARAVLKNDLRHFRDGIEFTAEEGERRTLQLDHLIDTIYFGNSHESIMLQLADCCAFFIKRTAMGRPDAEPFFRIIRTQSTPSDPRPMWSGTA
jgi:hypothetical protein